MEKRPIVHLEIAAHDRLQAANFYQQAFGWDINDHADQNYTTLAYDDSGQSVGINQAGEEFNIETIAYIHSDDVQADLARIEALGGQTVRYRPFNGGEFGFFKDPAGNMLGLLHFNPAE